MYLVNSPTLGFERIFETNYAYGNIHYVTSIDFFVGILLKIQLKGYTFFGTPCIIVYVT